MVLATALAGVAWPAASSGQQDGPIEAARAAPAPIEAPTHHWIYPLLDRMAADGLLDGVWLPGRRPAGAGAVAAALDTAAARAGADTSWRATVAAARAWFRDELVLDDGGAGVRVQPLLGFRGTDGPRLDPTAGLAGARVLARPGDGWGVWADPVLEVGDGGVGLPTPRLGAAWRTGNLRVAASHGVLRFEPGAGGGIVVGGEADLTRLELALAEPARLPWVLRHAGPVQASASVSRIPGDSLGPTVTFITGELRVQPHPRVTLGAYRSAVVVWTVDGAHPGLRKLVDMLMGQHTGFDDQKLALSAVVRADVLGVRLVPYAVWGAEDSAGLDEDPGVVMGAWLPAIPAAGVPVGLRYEYTAFGEDGQVIWPWSDPFEPRSWYRHSGSVRAAYLDGEGELLGHPLGGYGREHRVELEAVVPGPGLVFRAGWFDRDRPGPIEGGENLLFGVMPGRSRGGTLAGWVQTGSVRYTARLMLDDGAEGWSRAELRLEGRVLLDNPRRDPPN